MHAARRRAAQRVRNARERRIEVITSLPFEDKRDILRFFRHIIGSADPAGPLIPARFSIRRAASTRSSGGFPGAARDEKGFEILKIVEKSGASGPRYLEIALRSNAPRVPRLVIVFRLL